MSNQETFNPIPISANEVGDTNLLAEFEQRTSGPNWAELSEARLEVELAKRKAADATTMMHVTGALAIIAEQNAQEERLRAETDPLTNIKNRAWAERAMDELRAQDRTFGLVLADVDGMKQVNDIYGHEGGDAQLIAVARIITDNIRHADNDAQDEDTSLRGDTIAKGRAQTDECRDAARMGGDEFWVILPDIDDEEALADITARLEEAFATSMFELTGKPLQVSLGASIYRPGDDIASVKAEADAAMYQDKRTRTGREPRNNEQIVFPEQLRSVAETIGALASQQGIPFEQLLDELRQQL